MKERLSYHLHCQLEPLDKFNKDNRFQHHRECLRKDNLKYSDQLYPNITYLPPSSP